MWLQESRPASPAISHSDHCRCRQLRFARCPLPGEALVVDLQARCVNFRTASMFLVWPALTDRDALLPGIRRSLRGRQRVHRLGQVSKLEATVLFVVDCQRRKPGLGDLSMQVRLHCYLYRSPKLMMAERLLVAARRTPDQTALELVHRATRMPDQSAVALRTPARLA